MGRRLEVNGLQYGDSGRTCIVHSGSCGSDVKIGDILLLTKEEKQFEEEIFTQSRKEELESFNVALLKEILKAAGVKTKSKPLKADLIQAILIHEGEQFGADLQAVEVNRWTEVVFTARLYVNGKTTCKIGYVSRAFAKILNDQLDDAFVKVISLKKDSEFKSEREEGYRNGGVAVVELVQMEITFR